MRGDRVLVAADIGLASLIVFVVVVFSVDQGLHLGDGCVELHPLLVGGL